MKKNAIKPFLYWALQIGDMLLISLMLWISIIQLDISNNNNYIIIGVLAIITHNLIKNYFNQDVNITKYELCTKNYKVIASWALTIFVISTTIFAANISINYSRYILGFWFVATPFILIAYRVLLLFVLNNFRRKGFLKKKVAIIGDSTVAKDLIDNIKQEEHLGLKIYKIYKLDQIDECVRSASLSHFDRLYIANETQNILMTEKLLNLLSDSSVEILYVPDQFGVESRYSTWTNIGNIEVMSLNESPMYGVNLYIKRLEDIVLSMVFLILLSPVLVITSILIKLNSPGPVLFKQNRFGLNGREIKVWKFRSMTVCENQNITQATKNDTRVTAIGKYIRKTSIDELPQLFNVLNNEMSIVGPRPHAVQHNLEFRKLIPNYMRRHIVKPGITGWAQVNGWRGQTDTVEKIIKRTEYDLSYIRNWSLYLDIKIITLTVFTQIFTKDAY